MDALTFFFGYTCLISLALMIQMLPVTKASCHILVTAEVVWSREKYLSTATAAPKVFKMVVGFFPRRQ